MKQLFLPIAFLILLSSCKKEPIEPVSNCPAFEIPATEIENYVVDLDCPQYKMPFFHPEDPNRLGFVYENFEENRFLICTFDLNTNELQIIAENIIPGTAPKWNKTGWIAFDDLFLSDQIYVVQQNGEGLKQISDDNGYFRSNVNWDNSGDTLFWSQLKNGRFNGFFKTETGNWSTQIAPWGPSRGSRPLLSQNGEWLIYDPLGISFPAEIKSYKLADKYANIHRSQLLEIFEFQGILLEGLCWAANQTDFYYSYFLQHNAQCEECGLYIKTEQGPTAYQRRAEKLMDYCDTKYYRNMAASPDGRYLAAERVDRKLRFTDEGEFKGTVETMHSIYLIDLETFEEIKLDIPQP